MRYECYMCEWEGDEDELKYSYLDMLELCPSCGSDNIDLYSFDLSEFAEETDGEDNPD